MLWKMVFEELWKEGITRDDVSKELKVPAEEIEALVGELVAASPPASAPGQRPALRVV